MQTVSSAAPLIPLLHYHTKMVLSDAWEAEPLQITEAFIPTFESPPLLPKELSCSKLRNAALLARALADASHTSAEHMTATPSQSLIRLGSCPPMRA